MTLFVAGMDDHVDRNQEDVREEHSELKHLNAHGWFMPYVAVGLRNRVAENKCYANVVFQALKASPSIRNYVLQNLRGVYPKPTPIVNSIEKKSFWDSFLFNEKRDGRCEFVKSGAQPDFLGGFFIESNNTRFLTVDIPWKHQSLGFMDKFNIEDTNDLQEVHDAIDVVDKACGFSEEKVFVQVQHDHDKGVGIAVAQLDGPILFVSPILPPTRGDNKYEQINGTQQRCPKNRIELDDVHYKKCINEAINEMWKDEEFVISESGRVLFVGIDTRVDVNSIAFSDHSAAQYHTEYRVVHKMLAKPYLHVGDQFFVLVAIVKSTPGNHFVVFVHGSMDQRWVKIDDSTITVVNTANQLQPRISMNMDVGVLYMYERINVDSEESVDDIIKSLEENLDIVQRNDLTIRNTSKDGCGFSFSPMPFSKINFNKIINNNTNSGEDNTYNDLYSMNSQAEIGSEEEADTQSESMKIHSSTNTSVKAKATAQEPTMSLEDEIHESDMEDETNKANTGKVKVKHTSQSQEKSNTEDVWVDGYRDLPIQDKKVIGQTFYVRDGLLGVRGQVTEVVENRKKQIYYRVYYDKEDTYNYIQPSELSSLLLNGRNGTLFPGKIPDYELTEILAHALKEGIKSKKTGNKPTDYKFQMNWGDDKNQWYDYNETMYGTKLMKKYVKEHLNTNIFAKHYKDVTKDEPVRYRYGPATDKMDEHVKITLMSDRKVNYSMPEALKYFKKTGIDRIKKQYELLPPKQRESWFHVETGVDVTLTTGYGEIEECKNSVDFDIFDNYYWSYLDEKDWFKSFVIKTHGVFCLAASSLNSLPLDEENCKRIFILCTEFHTSQGEVRAGTFLRKIQELKVPQFVLLFHKIKKMCSFRDFEMLVKDIKESSVFVISYETLHGSTHAITWDVLNKIILDTNSVNEKVFKYVSLVHSSSIARSIVDSLDASLDIPCIHYYSFWVPKASKKRKKEMSNSNDD